VTDDVRDIPSAPEEATTEADDLVTGKPASEEAERNSPAKTRRWRPRVSPVLRRILYVLVALALLTSGGVATWLYFKQYRPDQQTDNSVKQSVAGSASDGTTALLSYSSETLEQDFANARSHLAGDFLTYYNDFTQQIVAPTARQRSLKTTAHVTGAAVSELRPDSAVVLLFVDQTTTTKDSPKPSVAISTVLVHISRINDKWLITKFNPV
jgi:Mce-associated membrane protein